MKNIHVVFPKAFHDRISTFFNDIAEYNVINFDNDLSTFKHYMLMRNENINVADIALIAVFENYNVPLEVQINELIERTVEVKLTHEDLRIVLILPNSYERDTKLMKELIGIGIYDIYFQVEFGFEDIVHWLNNPKKLSDMRNFIKVNGQEPRELTDTSSVTKLDVEKVDVNTKQKDTSTKPTTEKAEVKAPTKVVEKVVRLTTKIEQKKIGVIAMSKGAGATFHATNLSSYLAENDINVGLYEYPKTSANKTYLADVFNLFSEGSLAEQKISVPHKISRKEDFLADSYMVNGVNIYASNYALGRINDFSATQTLKYINTGKHLIKVFDLGCMTDEDLSNENLAEMLLLLDSLIVVVDLLPTSLVPNYTRLKRLKEIIDHQADLSSVYVINKFNDEIPKKEYKQLELSHAINVKDLGREVIMKSMFSKQSPYDYDQTVKSYLSKVYGSLENLIGVKFEKENKEQNKSKKRFAIFGAK